MPLGRFDDSLPIVGYCTCGSAFPEGASFCPNCARPLWPGAGEASESWEDSPDEEIDFEPTAEQRGWREEDGSDGQLKAAYVPAICAVVLRFGLAMMSPLLAMLSYLIPCGAGFATVRLFEKRERIVDSVPEGGGIGAMTGLLCLLPSVFLQLFVLAIRGKEAVLAPISDQAGTVPLLGDLLNLLQDPIYFAIAVAFGLALDGLLLLAGACAGGMIAAKLSRNAAA